MCSSDLADHLASVHVESPAAVIASDLHPRDIAQSDRDGIIVRSIIGMAKSLGLAVIAEGVETPLQLEMLAEEQCDIYQGFLKAPALNSDDLMRFVAAK